MTDGARPAAAATPDAGVQPAYGRILLKLSGEALMGSQPFGIDEAVVAAIADEIVEVARAGVQTAIVIGGGNLIRGSPGPGLRRRSRPAASRSLLPA